MTTGSKDKTPRDLICELQLAYTDQQRAEKIVKSEKFTGELHQSFVVMAQERVSAVRSQLQQQTNR